VRVTVFAVGSGNQWNTYTLSNTQNRESRSRWGTQSPLKYRVFMFVHTGNLSSFISDFEIIFPSTLRMSVLGFLVLPENTAQIPEFIFLGPDT
jgi:hypothetical protein